MVLAFSVSNTAPSVSEVLKDGTKIVSVNNIENDCRTNVRVSAQKADEFIKERNTIRKQSEKKIYRTLGISTLLGAVAGGLIGSKSKEMIKEHATKLRAGGLAALLGALCGFTGMCLLTPLFFNSEKAVSKLDQRFIKENS